MINPFSALDLALRGYGERQPDESEGAAAFLQLLDQGQSAFTRQHHGAHFTGSAWLVSSDGERVLLTHHRKLDRWLQLGGHADGDTDLARVALREAEEESGLTGLRVLPMLFDLDRHIIPARPGEPEHWHYDARYVVQAGSDEAFKVSAESHALAWRRVEDLLLDASLDPSIRRMASKWLARTAGRGAENVASVSPAA